MHSNEDAVQSKIKKKKKKEEKNMFDQDALWGSMKGDGVSHCVCSRTLCMYKKINKKTLMLYINSNYCVIRSCLNTSHTVNHSTPQQSSEAGTLDPTGWKKTQR